MSSPVLQIARREAGETNWRILIPVGDSYSPGSQADFDRLYRTTYPRIHATLVTLLRDPAAAEDCAQEAFVRGFRSWSQWNEDAPAEAWIHRIALNTAFTYRRRERMHDLGEVLLRLGRPPASVSADEGGMSPVVDAVRKLPHKQGVVVVLRYLHGYSNREISKILNIPEATVASRLSTARAHLHDTLGHAVDLEPQDGSVPLEHGQGRPS